MILAKITAVVLLVMAAILYRIWEIKDQGKRKQARHERYWKGIAAKVFTRKDRKELEREFKEDAPFLNRRLRQKAAREHVAYLKNRAKFEVGNA